MTPSPRDPHVDNIKAVLVTLVVVGHALGQTLGAYPPAGYVYTWIYLFHMPAFAFVSGLLSVGYTVDRNRAAGMLRTLVLPYLVFQGLYASFWAAHGDPLPDGLDLAVTPLYQLWFLVALLLWRLATPFLTSLRFPLLTTVALAWVSGSSDLFSEAFALNRTVVFLPFFTLGLLHGRAILRAVRRRVWLYAVPPLLAVSAVGAAVYRRQFGTANLPGNWHAMGVSTYEGLGLRAGLLALGVALTIVVVTVTPKRRSFLTVVGTYSLYPFLLHGFFTRGYGHHGPKLTELWEVAVLVLGAVALTGLLSSPPARRLFRALVEPPNQWFVSPATTRSASVAPANDRAAFSPPATELAARPLESLPPQRPA